MAQLTPEEFRELTGELLARRGMRAVQERLAKSNVVVSRRGISSEAAMARTLYGLTAGLAREGAATHLVIAMWEEGLAAAIDDEAGRVLEDIAGRVNACLTPGLDEVPGREEELVRALESYRESLAARVGERAARLTMLMRAVPAVARRIRSVRATAQPGPGSTT